MMRSGGTPRKLATSGELDERCRHYGRVLGKLFGRLDRAESGLSPAQMAWLEANPFTA